MPRLIINITDTMNADAAPPLRHIASRHIWLSPIFTLISCCAHACAHYPPISGAALKAVLDEPADADDADYIGDALRLLLTRRYACRRFRRMARILYLSGAH